MSTNHYVGIDVAKAWLDVHVLPSEAAWRVANDARGHRLLIDQIAALPVERIVMEASGGYERAIVQALRDAGFTADAVNPRQTHAFAKARGRLAKTDKLDAAILADFAAHVPTSTSIRRSADTEQLAQTLAYRRQLQSQIGQLANQLEHFTDPAIRRRLQQRQRSMIVERKALDLRLRRLARATPRLAQIFDQLVAVPGIGSLVACTLIVDLPELGSLDRRKIAALVGLAPICDDSGKRRGQRHIGGGRTNLRNALYRATFVGTTKNPAIRAAFQRLRNAGKPFKLALTACMRKLLVSINAMARDNTPWRVA